MTKRQQAKAEELRTATESPLKRFFKENRITQGMLAVRVGTTQGAISAALNGGYAPVRIQKALEKLAKELGARA